MKNVFFYETDIGEIGIADNGAAITDLYFADKKNLQNVTVNETILIKEAATQLNDYIAGKRKTFEIPLVAEGTPFQQLVWEALKAIPYGETRSYKEIAASIGQPQASRAVGMANNKNPILIFVPCHRVVDSKGKLVGYAGGLDVKGYLLNLERQYANS